MDNDRYPTFLALSRAAVACRLGHLSCALLVAGGLAACATAPTEAARAETGTAAAVVADAPGPPPAAPAETAPVPDVVAVPTAADPVPAPVEPPPVDEASNVFFASRSAWIDAAGQQKLRDIADRLAGNRRSTVLLIGHNDGQGSRSYNLAITEERLNAVSKLLRSYGVAAHQLRRNRVAGVRSAPDCKDEACWRLARRVELVVKP